MAVQVDGAKWLLGLARAVDEDRHAMRAEAQRLTHPLGSHADGHRCTCTELDPGKPGIEPDTWEQDPWCPTHPDVDQIRPEFDRLRAVVEAVQALADEPGSGFPYVRQEALRRVLAVAASVGSSGEASGCETCGGSGFIAEADDPDYPEAGAHQIHCPDCPALSSGEAERPRIDLHGSTVHGRLSVPDLGPFTLANGIFEPCSDCTHFPEHASVELSGEAESGCGHPNHGAADHDCTPFTPAPVSSGGQADGAGESFDVGLRLDEIARLGQNQRVPGGWLFDEVEGIISDRLRHFAAARPVPQADGVGECCAAFTEAACEVGHRILIDDGDGGDYACPVCALAARPVPQANGEGEQVKRAIRTLLPGLRVANYSERWAAASPAVRALTILCEYVGQPVDTAGDLVDPHMPTMHDRPLSARPVLSREALRDRLDGHWPDVRRDRVVVCDCGWKSDDDNPLQDFHQWRDHLADVLTAGGEQRG